MPAALERVAGPERQAGVAADLPPRQEAADDDDHARRARRAAGRARAGGDASSVGARVDLGAQDAHEPEVAVVLAVVEAVADDELVRDREADVVDRDVDEAPGRLVEQRADPERAGVLAAQVAEQVVERQARVDDVLDDQDVLALDASPTGP